jgi:ribosomal protein S18 acetylase RimI-like enzyme
MNIGYRIERLEGSPAECLDALIAESEAQRLRFGRGLAAEVTEAARGRFDRLRLRTGNPAAAEFYERLGFRRCVEVADCTHELELR